MIGPAMTAVIKKHNVKTMYTMWADYNYGHICATWLKKFAEDNGVKVAASDFFPLDVTDFSTTITKIQQPKPDLVVSGLVGGNHIGFYRQWPAAGMLGKIPAFTGSVRALGEESPEAKEAEGITASYHYFQTIDAPANKAFLEKWPTAYGADHPEIGTIAA